MYFETILKLLNYKNIFSSIFSLCTQCNLNKYPISTIFGKYSFLVPQKICTCVCLFVQLTVSTTSHGLEILSHWILGFSGQPFATYCQQLNCQFMGTKLALRGYYFPYSQMLGEPTRIIYNLF